MRNKKKYVCTECGIPFGLKSHLNRHVATVHHKQKKYVCTKCGEAFGQLSHLNAHIASIHEHSFCDH